MGLHGGKWIWTNTADGTMYTEIVDDTSPNNIAAANSRASTALAGQSLDLITVKTIHGTPRVASEIDN